MRSIIILKEKSKGGILFMEHKKYSMATTENERNWFHTLSKKEKKSIPLMIIECFRKKSRILGIPLPEKIIPDHKRNYRKYDHCPQDRENSLKRMLEESPQLSFI